MGRNVTPPPHSCLNLFYGIPEIFYLLDSFYPFFTYLSKIPFSYLTFNRNPLFFRVYVFYTLVPLYLDQVYNPVSLSDLITRFSSYINIFEYSVIVNNKIFFFFIHN